MSSYHNDHSITTCSPRIKTRTYLTWIKQAPSLGSLYEPTSSLVFQFTFTLQTFKLDFHGHFIRKCHEQLHQQLQPPFGSTPG
ncbi:hypothetical protein L2E82_20700 [Cichorium intybus]|uniref:Uncharacterized protein n=1 Tax=Cichorium intybus TaxID=13427 RepID=A0ACB9DUD8_CICIN|nr:hypothetical protein L2E82_20700 [Cichorium intybus]